jgi:hypothetical protein
MNPRVKDFVEKEIAEFEKALKSNGGQPLSRYEYAILRSYLRYKAESEAPASE